MGPIEWAKNGTTLGNRLAYEASRGRFTPAQAFQDAAYALGRARGSLEVFRGVPTPP